MGGNVRLRGGGVKRGVLYGYQVRIITRGGIHELRNNYYYDVHFIESVTAVQGR